MRVTPKRARYKVIINFVIVLNPISCLTFETFITIERKTKNKNRPTYWETNYDSLLFYPKYDSCIWVKRNLCLFRFCVEILIVNSWSLVGEVTWPYIWKGVLHMIKTKENSGKSNIKCEKTKQNVDTFLGILYIKIGLWRNYLNLFFQNKN